MKTLPSVLLVCFGALLAGCVPVPLPHEQWVSPRFHGTVTDAATGRPLGKVKITLRGYGMAEKELGPRVAFADEQGNYSVLATQLALWTPVWLVPAEGPQAGTVVFELPGYETVKERKSKFGSAYARPDFEVNVRLERNGQEQKP
jgi:hypothetical protein